MTQQLGAQDAQFLYLQSGATLTHIMGIYIYDPSTAPGGKVRFKDIVRHIDNRSHTSPVFRRKLYRLPFDFDHPYWVEDGEFNIEEHITHVRLPEPGDWRQFCIQVARHFSRRMDMNRPLWDVYVIEGLDRIKGVAPGSYALLHRIHHAAIDGVSGIHAFAALNDRDAKGTPALVPHDNIELGATPDALTVLGRSLVANLTAPARMTGELLKLAPAIAGAVRQSLTHPADWTKAAIPQTRFNAPLSPYKMFDATTFAIKDLSAIRRLVEGATLNDVALAICSGALRKYLLEHAELPSETLIAVAPINVRHNADEGETPGNKITAMSVELATNVADPVARLAAIRDFTNRAKQAKAGIRARVIADLLKHIPGATMASVARVLTSERFAPRQANLFISNVPGPQIPLYMNGAKLTHQFGMGPIANNMGLFIAAMSYNGTISFSVTSERKIMPDIDAFRRCIDEAFHELQRLTKPRATGRRRRPASIVTKPGKPSRSARFG